jgi:hypothetical protein
MRKVRFHLSGGLTVGEIERMWEGALRLIETVGLKVPHDGI